MSYKIVSHEISTFGKIEIVLHSKSLQFYNILEENGLIDNLKNLDHLGFISKSHPGNNHKRWDYIVLQLYILHKLKDGVFKIGLNSNNHEFEGTKVSGLEILQIFILFANIGHLKGTLASEIGLFEYLENNNARKAEFLAHIVADKEWKEYSDKVFNEHNYYKLKYLIAANFLKVKVPDIGINQIILKLIKNSLNEDDASIRKLRWIFHKVRQICFVYLDSFNSDFPFHIDINKILLNIFNYKTLFNPNSNDFELFFDSCETTLTKKIYISEISTLILYQNKINFIKFLKSEYGRSGVNKLNFNNFTLSLISREVKPFEILSGKEIMCLQYYLSKDDFETLGNTIELFTYKEGLRKSYQNEILFNNLLNKGLENKAHSVCILHDQNESLFYINLLVNKSKLSESEQNQFILNYANLHLQFISNFKYTELLSALKDIAIGSFYKNYCRKIFLQLFKIIFKSEHKLSAFIKFDNQSIINELSKMGNQTVYPTGFVKTKSKFLNLIDKVLKNNLIPPHIKNNHRILRHIVTTECKIGYNFNAFYCFFPIEIDKYELNPSNLYKQQNPETLTTITDIDLTVIIFNKTKFELYIIEGKNAAKGFKSAVKDDFANKISPNLTFPSSMPKVKEVNISNGKGGFICYKN